MGDPPSLAGAVNATDAWAFPAVALPILLEHVRAGRLELAGLVGPEFPLDRINEAIDASLSGVPGRVIVRP